MQIAQKLSGFTAGQADLLRRAMGKKKRAELEKQKQGFHCRSFKKWNSKRCCGRNFFKDRTFCRIWF
jgi:DNA polymerase-3 subunit alpha